MNILGIAIGALAAAGIYDDAKTSGIYGVALDTYNNNTQFGLVQILRDINLSLKKERLEALKDLKKIYVSMNSGYDGLYGTPNKTTIALYAKTKAILNNAYNAILKDKQWSRLPIKHAIDKILEQKKFSSLKEVGWRAGDKRPTLRTDWKAGNRRKL